MSGYYYCAKTGICPVLARFFGKLAAAWGRSGGVSAQRGLVCGERSAGNPAKYRVAQKLRTAGLLAVIIGAEPFVSRVQLYKAAVCGCGVGFPGKAQPLPV